MENYIQSFVDVCVSVFRDFCGCNVTAGRPFFLDPHAELHDWDISALIGLSGDAHGAVVLSMETATAVKLTNMLTGGSHTTIDDETIDATGEIINIIAGNVKQSLETYRIVISLPTIITGRGHKINWPGEHARIISVPFTFDGATFNLLVALKTVEGK